MPHNEPNYQELVASYDSQETRRAHSTNTKRHMVAVLKQIT